MNFIVLISTLASIFWTPLLSASPDNISFAICKNRKIVRTIRVDKAHEGCETTYTKSGLDKVVGSGSQADSCERIYNNIKANLESANWKCKEVSATKVSQSIEENPIQDTTFE